VTVCGNAVGTAGANCAIDGEHTGGGGNGGGNPPGSGPPGSGSPGPGGPGSGNPGSGNPGSGKRPGGVGLTNGHAQHHPNQTALRSLAHTGVNCAMLLALAALALLLGAGLSLAGRRSAQR
jgi:hypothetical protein